MQFESATSPQVLPALHARVLQPRLRHCIGAFSFRKPEFPFVVIVGVLDPPRLRPDVEAADAIVSGSALWPSL